MEFIWIWVGCIYALLLVSMAVDAIQHKTSWRAFAADAASSAGCLAAIGGLMCLVHLWLSHNPWSWLLLIGFIVVIFCVWFVVGVTGLLVQLLYRD